MRGGHVKQIVAAESARLITREDADGLANVVAGFIVGESGVERPIDAAGRLELVKDRDAAVLAGVIRLCRQARRNRSIRTAGSAEEVHGIRAAECERDSSIGWDIQCRSGRDAVARV